MNQEKHDLIDVLVSLRDSLIKAVEAINVYINTQTPPTVKVEELKEAFPQDLRGLLEFNLEGDQCVIKPRGFLGAENFSRIASIVRAHNGTYISDGKNSHFKVPIKT
ncbi:MAG: hypothetical protein QXK47_05500 [Candidatus Bathyarchaeia archaeon]